MEIRSLLKNFKGLEQLNLKLQNGKISLPEKFASRARRALKAFRKDSDGGSPPFSFLSYLEDEFPQTLEQLFDPPCILYHQGLLSLLAHNGPKLAVVGTRRASWYALEICEKLVEDTAPFQPLILSGMAQGVDGVAHRTALKSGIPTVGVLGTSLDKVFPWEHRGLQREMGKKALLLTEVYPGAPMGPWRFPERNRILAALADAVLVVEAPLKSGALVTAKLALELGREIFVVPGPLNLRRNDGGHRLIQEGAHLLNQVEELFEILGYSFSTKEGRAGSQDSKGRRIVFSEEERAILSILEEGPQHVDKIILISHLPAPVVSSILTMLCLQGRIVEGPGGVFKISK